MKISRGCRWLFGAALLTSLTACSSTPAGRSLHAPDSLEQIAPASSPVLKAHMKDGRLYVLSDWVIKADGTSVSGTGKELDINREPSPTGAFVVQVKDVALFETNAPITTPPAIVGMTLVTGVSVAVTVICLTNPKACFGSCPTFFVSDGTRPLLQAEGFSDSIAPSLEATDIDALYRARATDRNLSVRMTNEALETHVVKNVEILTVPRPEAGRVFHAEHDGFYGATALRPADHCQAPEGSCGDALRLFDGKERFSAADGHNLATREELTLEFPPASTSATGLVIAARQTLMTTFLLYQGLAYLGSQAGAALSELERDSSLRARVDQTQRLLGGIEVQVQAANGDWNTAGEVFETGPIATDVHLVRLPRLPPGAVHVRLRLTRGDWRIDWVALGNLTARIEPTRVQARAITGTTDNGRHVIVKPGDTIVTLPGDAYDMTFELPEHPERYELFLSSRGYYLEWIRQQWLAEESRTRAALLLYTPSLALRALAPAYKRQEADMERLFWGSRYVKP